MPIHGYTYNTYIIPHKYINLCLKVLQNNIILYSRHRHRQ